MCMSVRYNVYSPEGVMKHGNEKNTMKMSQKP